MLCQWRTQCCLRQGSWWVCFMHMLCEQNNYKSGCWVHRTNGIMANFLSLLTDSCQYILSSTNPCTISLVEWGELYSKLNTAIGQAPKDLRSSAQLAQISPPPLMQTCLLALPCHSEIPPTKWSWERRATLWANCLCIDSRTGTTNRPSPAFVQNLILPLNQVLSLWIQITLLIMPMTHHCKKEWYKLNRSLHSQRKMYKWIMVPQ